jgi:hypothetical protein
MVEERAACVGFWWGNLREKRPLGIPRRSRWEDNIRMIFRKWDVGFGLDWAGSG